MNSDIIYEVVKYLDMPSTESKILSAQNSKINKKRSYELNAKILEKKLSERPSLSELKNNNIYRESNYKINFEDIHKRLQNILIKDKPNELSNSLAHVVKTMDFKFKKVLLNSKFRVRSNEADS